MELGLYKNTNGEIMTAELFPWAPDQPSEMGDEPCIMIDALQFATGRYFNDCTCFLGLAYACIIPV